MSGSKINVAKQAVDFLENKLSEKMIIGIGTGTTVNFFIEQLKTLKHRFDGAVSSSDRSSAILQDAGIKVYELNGVNEIAYYVDGADEVSKDYSLIKGGGGAHTREKIVASASEHFICIVDKSKIVNDSWRFPSSDRGNSREQKSCIAKNTLLGRYTNIQTRVYYRPGQSNH